MLRLIAEAQGGEVSTTEIAERLGLEKGASSVAGTAGAFGNRVSNRYGLSAPWASRWRHIDPSDPDRGTETMMSLPKWVCEVIAAAD